MKKLNEAKPSIDAHQIESDQKKKFKLAQQMSRNGTKFIKHPFFISENPAATLYRNLMDQGGYQSRKNLVNKSIREHFQSIMNGTTIQTSCKSAGNRNYY